MLDFILKSKMSYNKFNDERLGYIDVARGIAILLVVCGHCIGAIRNPVNQFFLSFHMPLFFVISGMLFNPQKKEVFSVCLKKNFIHLLVPQVTLGIFECVFIVLSDYFKTGGIHFLSVNEIVHSIMKWWFLIVMFELNMVNFFLKKIWFKYIGIGIFFFILFFVMVVLCVKPQGGIAYVNILPFAMFFYFFGFYCKKISMLLSGNFYFIIALFLICAIVSHFNSPVLMYANDYGNLFLFAITSLTGSLAVINLSKKVNINFLVWCGKVSIILYVLQFHINQYCRKFIYTLTGVERLSNESFFVGLIDTFLIFILSLSICLLLTWLITKTRYVKKAFGYRWFLYVSATYWSCTRTPNDVILNHLHAKSANIY